MGSAVGLEHVDHQRPESIIVGTTKQETHFVRMTKGGAGIVAIAGPETSQSIEAQRGIRWIDIVVVGFARRNQADSPSVKFALGPEAIGIEPKYEVSTDRLLEMIAGLQLSRNRKTGDRRDRLADEGMGQAEEEQKGANHQAIPVQQESTSRGPQNEGSGADLKVASRWAIKVSWFGGEFVVW
jgi:hypothetical protein